MNENLIEAQYDVQKKSKFKKFYEANKILIFSTIIILVLALASSTYYFDVKNKKKILLADNYIKAEIYLQNGEKNKALNILKTLVSSNDKTYSTLSLFLILNQNLAVDKKEMLKLFNYILKNNEHEKEIKNLIIFKKALFQSDFASEQEILEVTKPLINYESVWKPHALLLLGDYFIFKKEYLKAKEFYMQILPMKNLDKEMYDYAKSRMVFIANE